MQDSNNSKPENESLEPSSAPSPLSNQPRVTLEEMTQSHMMLIGFRDAVQKGTYQGVSMRDIALGLDFLGRMIETSKMQLEFAKREQEVMKKRSKEAIAQAGGQINEKPVSQSTAA